MYAGRTVLVYFYSLSKALCQFYSPGKKMNNSYIGLEGSRFAASTLEKALNDIFASGVDTLVLSQHLKLDNEAGKRATLRMGPNSDKLEVSYDGGVLWEPVKDDRVGAYQWKAGTAYKQGDFVLLDSALYVCRTDTDSEVPGNGSCWERLSHSMSTFYVDSNDKLKAALEYEGSPAVRIMLTGTLSGDLVASVKPLVVSMYSDESVTLQWKTVSLEGNGANKIYWRAGGAKVSQEYATNPSVSCKNASLYITSLSAAKLTLEGAVSYEQIKGTVSGGTRQLWDQVDTFSMFVPRDFAGLAQLSTSLDCRVYVHSDVRDGWVSLTDILRAAATEGGGFFGVDSQGPLSARPVSADLGYCYYATDTGDLYRYGKDGWSEPIHVKGDKGAKGDKGDKGDTGPANMLQHDVVCATADSTEAASAFISGTYPNQQLNLRIPKGEKGAKGDPGDDGFSPAVTVTQTETGATIVITDKNGPKVANLANGSDASYTLPAATVDTLGGVKIGDNIEVAGDGTISAVVPQLEEDVTSWEVNTVPGAVEFFALRSTVAKADNDIVIDWGDGTSTVLKTAEVIEYTDGSASTDGMHYVDNPDHKVTCYTGEWEADGELAFGFEHVYQTTNTAAKIVIKGSNYFGISRAINYNNWRGSLDAFLTDHHPLMSRCLAEDLPVAKCVNNLSWFAAFTDKLSKVHIPTGWDLDRIENWYGCFMYSSIQDAKGFSYKLSYANNCAELFSHCSQLKSCDFKFPCMLKYASTCNATFWGCINLEGDIASFFPKAGLAVSRKAEFKNTFNSCAKLIGTVPAKQLWENANVEWTNAYNAFASCSDAIRAQVPVEWGGTMVRSYKDTYKGQLKREQTTVEVTGQNQQLTLDAGQTACLVITGAGTCNLVLSNWEDGDSCEVVVNTSQVTLQLDGSWVTRNLDITTTPGLHVLELAQYSGVVFCKVKYPA